MLSQEEGDPLAGKRLEQVFQHYSLAFWSGLLISAVPVLALWTVTDRAVLLGWMLALWLELALRYAYARRFWRFGYGTEQRKWRLGVVAIAAIDGAFWGLSVWLLPASPTGPATTLLLLIIACSAIFDGKALAAVPAAAISCLATTLLPVAFWLLSFDSQLTTLMGIATLLYFGLVLIFSRQNYHSLCRLLSSTERNAELAAEQRENERRMARYFESAPGFFYTLECRPDGSYAMPFASAGIREIFGLEPEAVIQDISALVALDHPDDIEMAFRKTEESARDLTPYHIEYRIIHPQKGLRWIEASSLPQRMADGGTRWDGFMHDITERKQAEEKHSALQRQLQIIADNLPGAVTCNRMFPDGSGKVLYANKGLQDVFGFTQQDLADDITPMAWRIHPEDLPQAAEKMIAAAKALSTYTGEFRVNHPDKGEIWVQQTSTPVYESESSMLWYGLMFDITERKQAEQQLKEALAFNEGIINAIPDILFEMDRDGRYLNFWTQDPVAREVNKTALLGKTVSEVLPREVAEEAMAAIREADEKGSAYGKAIPIVQPDGEVRWYEHSLSKKIGRSPTETTILAVSRDVTERKRMEQALLEREREYRTLAENFPDVVIRYDRDCRRTYVNPAFAALAGISASGMIGKTPQDTTPLLDSDRYMAELRRVLESGVPIGGELSVRRANGDACWYMGSFVPEFDTEGNIAGALMVARDITERKRMEAALQESEAQHRHKSNLLQSVLESASSVGIYAVDRDYRYLAFNRLFREGAKRLWGADVAVGMSMLDAIDTDAHREFCRQGFDYVLAGNDFFLESKEEVIRDGVSTFEHHDNYASPIRDENGAVIGATVFTTNTTERKKTANQLEETRARLQTVLRTLPDMVWLKDADGVYLSCNHVFERCFGATEAEIVGKTDYDFVDAELADFFRQKDREALEAGRICINEEWVTIAADGCQALLETRKVPVYGEDGKVAGILGVARDITERKRMEEALRAREHEYRTLAENFPEIVIRYDRDCRRVYVSRGFARLAEAMQSEALGKMPSEGSPLVDAEAYMAELRKVMEHGITTRLEFAARIAPGELGWHLGSFVPEFDAAGNVAGVLVVGRDITERKRMEAALQASEAKHRHKSNLLHSLMDSASDVVVYALDRNYRYLSFNRKHSETYKRLWDVDIALGMSMLEVIKRDDFREFCRQGFDYVLAGNSFAVESQEEVVKDGCPVYEYWENYGSPIRDDDGKVIGLTVFAVNVTQRRQAEQQLKQALEFTEGVINAIPDLLFEMDQDGRYQAAWTHRPELLAAQKEMLLGKTVHDVLSPEAAETVMGALREAAEKGLSFGSIIRIDLPGGPRWFEESVSRKSGSESGDARFIILSRDVTERQQAETELRESRAQLRGLIVQRENTREEERKLIAREVHDELGQILTGLKLNIAAMGRKYATDSEPLREQVREIASLTETAIGVARDISATLRPAGLDMGVLASTKWLAGRWSAYTGIVCNVRAGNEIHLDESRAVAVFRIVQESLTNIAKHAQASRVDIRIEQDAGGHVLKIRDNGRGFDPRTEKQGSFGLVGMRERALMLGGNLVINSKPGSGTEIVVTIPAQNT